MFTRGRIASDPCFSRLLGLVCVAQGMLGGACAHTARLPSPGFVLYSPLEEEATESWRALLESEVRSVGAFLQAPSLNPPVDVYLNVAQGNKNRSLELIHGIGGQADGWSIHLVVSPTLGGHASATPVGLLRHELTHVFVRRLGWGAPAWLDEGLAHEIEEAVRSANGLRLHPAPTELLLARAYAEESDIAHLWKWDGRGSSPREKRYRILARAFVRFLIERETSGKWQEGLARAATLSTADLAPLVLDWRQWLMNLRLVSRIELATRDADPSIRASGAAALPILAETIQGLAKLGDGDYSDLAERMDDLAIKLVCSSVCAEPAGRYLVYFRAATLSEDEIGVLEGSSHAWPRVVAAILRIRRGQGFDAGQARALWKELCEQEAGCYWVARALGIETSRSRPRK
jgi:hypothetical protein